MANRVIKYDTDPASASSTGKPVLPFSIYDVPRLMAAIRAGLVEGLPPLKHPSDELLISTVVAHGMPRWAADQMRHNPMLRLHYCMFWADVKAAAQGNKEAQGRIDGAREAWKEMRKIELISDRPDHTIGLWER